MTTQNPDASSATLPPARKQPLAFIEGLPENLRLFYKDIARVLKSPYMLLEKGIGFKVPGARAIPPFCSPFRVTTFVQERNLDNWSRVIELVNPLGELVECVIPNGKLDGKPRDAIAMLSDRGLLIFNDSQLRTILQLIRNWPVPKDSYNVLIEKVGWTFDFDAFITPSGRVITRNNAAPRYRIAGNTDGKEVGDLDAWRDGVAALAVGNTNLIFAIALGLSTALLPFTNLASVIFHLFGQTSRGKTRVLRAGLTVWPKIGEKDKTWSATQNGLEGETAQSNHILLGLDELPKDAPAELGNMIYKISLGSGKGRSEKDGSAIKRSSWWNAPTEVVHLLGYDYPVFRRTNRWLESERSPRILCSNCGRLKFCRAKAIWFQRLCGRSVLRFRRIIDGAKNTVG